MFFNSSTITDLISTESGIWGCKECILGVSKFIYGSVYFLYFGEKYEKFNVVYGVSMTTFPDLD